MTTLEIIRTEVESYFNLEEGTINRRTRKQYAREPRQLAHYIACKINGNSLEKIGQELGHVGHCAVIHSRNIIGDYITPIRGIIQNPKMKNDIDELMEKINIRRMKYERSFLYTSLRAKRLRYHYRAMFKKARTVNKMLIPNR